MFVSHCGYGLMSELVFYVKVRFPFLSQILALWHANEIWWPQFVVASKMVLDVAVIQKYMMSALKEFVR